MPVWPNTLPVGPLTSGYSETSIPQVIRTQMDAGVPKVRRRSTVVIQNLHIELALTPSQCEVLRQFYTNDCAQGVLRFSWIHPRTDVAIFCRFLNAPSIRPTETWSLFRVSFDIEVLP